MLERGKVVEVLAGQKARVSFKSSAACVQCGICVRSGEKVWLTVRNEAGARTGDEVEVEIPVQNVFWGSFQIFILPIIALILGYLIGGVLWAFIFLGLSFVLLWAYDRFYRSSKTACKIIKVVS